MPSGWYRYPTVRGDRVIFVTEDDLWSVGIAGGQARRLTSGLGAAARPHLSPDGTLVAFDGAEEGVRDVYVVSSDGGELRRLTWIGDNAAVIGWSAQGEILFTSAFGQPFVRDTHAFAVPLGGGPPVRLPYGPLAGIAHGPAGQIVLCRHVSDLARWKGYRGGRAGALWHRAREGEPFVRLSFDANVGAPLFVGDKLWFIADPEGIPQLFSARIEGGRLVDVAQRTSHEGMAVRFPSASDGVVVYAHGGDLYRLSADEGALPERIDIDFRGQRAERQRRFPSVAGHLESFDLHPDGHSILLTVRGQAFTLGHWDGAALKVPSPAEQAPTGERYRLARFIDADRILAAHDQGEEKLVIASMKDRSVRRLDALEHGWIVDIEVSPDGRWAALTDHTYALYVLDLDSLALLLVDRSSAGTIDGLDWSQDSRLLAYARPEGPRGSRAKIRIFEVVGARSVDVTSGEYLDRRPSFDPDGRYLYFLSHRVFDPVPDNQLFGYGFPRAVRPYLVTLHKDTPSPLQPDPKPPKASAKVEREERPPDLEGLSDRIVAIPIVEGQYEQIMGLPGGQVWVVRAPMRGALSRNIYETGPPKADSQLLLWEHDKQELTEIAAKVSYFRPDRRRETAVIRVGSRLRAVSIRNEKPQRDESRKSDAKEGRKGGFIELSRVRLQIDPGREWAQMLREAWRRMRDHFWDPSLGGVDWEAVYARYAPLVERISTRGELSDLVWCMQGELGTSHAYEMGGDYSSPPTFRVGRLGADLSLDEPSGRWRVAKIPRGEPGDSDRCSPLVGPGLDVREGDALVAINGEPLSPRSPPEVLLVHQANTLVSLTFQRGDEPARSFLTRTLQDDRELRYRAWVLANRREVHARTDGRCGYIHVPDMSPWGFAEFHRDYARESERDALIVDVRHNGGGHVSQLLLAKLGSKRLGYKVRRHGIPIPYPAASVAGPMVALADEVAGSDGDIFSHAWKRLGLGPLVGTRTWGGVVGIRPRELLVDRSITTQPEYASWFEDAGFGIENYGVDPDVFVEITPDDWAEARDPQLQRAIEIATEQLASRPPLRPPSQL